MGSLSGSLVFIVSWWLSQRWLLSITPCLWALCQLARRGPLGWRATGTNLSTFTQRELSQARQEQRRANPGHGCFPGLLVLQLLFPSAEVITGRASIQGGRRKDSVSSFCLVAGLGPRTSHMLHPGFSETRLQHVPGAPSSVLEHVILLPHTPGMTSVHHHTQPRCSCHRVEGFPGHFATLSACQVGPRLQTE